MEANSLTTLKSRIDLLEKQVYELEKQMSVLQQDVTELYRESGIERKVVPTQTNKN